MSSIEESKERARNLNEFIDHLIKLIESDDKRFSFEFCISDTMEIYDKEKEIGYIVRIGVDDISGKSRDFYGDFRKKDY